MSSFSPGFVLILGGLLLPFLPVRMRRTVALLLSAATLYLVSRLEAGTVVTVGFWGLDLTILEVDALSIVFGWIFGITVLVWCIYAWHLEGRLEPASALVYGGSALGVVFAGALLTLFLFWELMALASTGVILAAGTAAARRAAFRYILVHLTGGVLLLIGIALRSSETGSLAFGPLGLVSPGTWLICLGFAVNAAIPPLSAWLPDAYPEGSPSGSVFLSAFTTKTAVYVLATAFAGENVLLVLGAIMSLYGIFYALNENDARRVLSYSIINQVGFMVCGIGLAQGEWADLAINGVAAHAFCHILYKSLLFMSAGAVLYRTGRTKCTELGGLWRTMPWTLVFGLVGALSISALPLTNGFVSKTIIVQAAANGSGTSGLFMAAYVILMIASAGVSLHAGIKFPWFVFFAKDRGLRPKEAPGHMLLAMAIVSALCIGLGVWPKPLYDILPAPMASLHFVPYTPDHVVLQLEILIASAFAFFYLLPVLKRSDTITLDTDWFYRKGGRAAYRFVEGPLMRCFGALSRAVHETLPRRLAYLARNPAGAMRLAYDRGRLAVTGLFRDVDHMNEARARYDADLERYRTTVPSATWPVGRAVLYGVLALAIYLLVYLLG
ncbi:MAG: Na(+)/H(+) antiporter subunit D [Planctomycetota bacterium]|jgi:multicomponent Na+:H+ antiporter subunit D